MTFCTWCGESVTEETPLPYWQGDSYWATFLFCSEECAEKFRRDVVRLRGGGTGEERND